MTLTIWSDFACPYCYIGETRLQQAIDELGLKDNVQIDYRAYELDPSASKRVVSDTPTRFAMKYRLSVDDAKKQIEHISSLGREVGLDFRYATTRYTNTRDAHRLMKLAEDKYDRETVSRLNEALFKAYFTDNLELADHDVLTGIATSVGIARDEIIEVLDSERYADEVRFDEREAAMRGIHGVPYILFNGSFAVPGAMSVDGFKSVLKREIAKQTEQRNENSETERPHSCGPDGCVLL